MNSQKKKITLPKLPFKNNSDWIEIFTELDDNFKLVDVQAKGSNLLTSVRTTDGKRYNFEIQDFRPYFFVPKGRLPYHLPFISIDECDIVVCNHPSEVRKKREQYQYTYEADILYDHRFYFDVLHNFNENQDIQARIWYVDIEVYNNNESSFPKPEEFHKFINSIAIYDNYTDTYLTIVVTPEGQDTGKLVNGNRVIVKVKSEELLLKFFIGLLREIQPDYIIGWNIILFDIPFLVERLKLRYPDLYQQLSVFNEEPRKHRNLVFNADEYEIPGYIVFDYMLLYRKFSSEKLPSYNLETVSQHELGKGKVKYDKSLDYIYKNDFNLFVKYNTEDVNLVKELEEKLTFISLVEQLKSVSYCKLYTFNFNNTLKFGDFIMMRYIREKLPDTQKVMRTKPSEVKTEPYSGAFVKTPKVGLYYDYIIDFDASSMYPSIIRTLNISPETFILRILEDRNKIRFHIRPYLIGLTDKFTLPQDTFNVRFPDYSIRQMQIDEIKDYIHSICGNNFTMAINGAVFRNDFVGVLKMIEDELAIVREANKNAKKVFGALQAEIQKQEV